MSNRRAYVIAMDGPAGVGKSTIGTMVAKELGYRFINTGEMYRALTWKALEEKIDLKDGKAVVKLAKRLQWEFKTVGEGVVIKTHLDGQGVTLQIRAERVSKNSSIVAGIVGVRTLLRDMQRALGKNGAIVMEGRDITTNVFPDADFKVYLDASIEERARRRTKQLRQHGKPANFEKIKEAIILRDMGDLKRKINPLLQAKDAVVINSTKLSMQETAEMILKLIRSKKRKQISKK
ncbi:MAG: cytidylate kinase [Elusimicrobia bacterium]|nr:MAG: cytidylate kinase [Elusimicrobiota bacterium]